MLVEVILAVDSADTFWEKVAIQATGPLVTVFFGGGVVWGITYLIQQSREGKLRKRAEKLAQDQIDRDRRARDDALRHELVTRLTEAAGPLYLMTQHYGRAKSDANEAPSDDVLKALKESIRAKLDAQYLQSRASGEALLYQLKGYFDDPRPCAQWHVIQDLLTVRYFQEIDRDTPTLYADNTGADHSGLDIDQLKESQTVLDRYRQTFSELMNNVLCLDLADRSHAAVTAGAPNPSSADPVADS